MEQKTHNNKPVDTLRDGSLKATIWRNLNNEGQAFYRVELLRTYKDPNGDYQDTSSFSGSEPLRIAHLAQRAYTVIGELRQSDRQAAAEDPAESAK